MIAVIRISGQVKVRWDMKDTLERLGLKKKYTCLILENPKKEELGMINKIKDFVAFGEISNEMYKKLVEARGKFTKSKTHFRLHPPRGGIDTKKHFGINRGVLGNHGKEIDKLIERML